MATTRNDIGHDPAGADDAPGPSLTTAAGPADTAVTFRAQGFTRPVVPGALQYSELHPATQTDYQFHAGSWLAGPDGFSYRSASASEPEFSVPEGWDPLTDPWPASDVAETVAEAPVSAVVQVVGARHRVGAHAAPVELLEPVALADIEMVAAEPEPVDHACLQTQPVDLTEWPEWEEQPAVSPAAVLTEPVDMANLFAPEPWDHPSGPLPHMGEWPPTTAVPDSPEEMFSPVSAFDATLTGPLGNIDLGFRAGHWYSLCGDLERRVSVGEAMWVHPQLAGQITQLACWWMRQNPMSERSLDLATELSMAVSEIARKTAHQEA